jgi:hypothetical protein
MKATYACSRLQLSSMHLEFYDRHDSAESLRIILLLCRKCKEQQQCQQALQVCVQKVSEVRHAGLQTSERAVHASHADMALD